MASEWMPRWVIFLGVITFAIYTISFLFAGVDIGEPIIQANDTSAIQTAVDTIGFGWIDYEPARWIVTAFMGLLSGACVLLALGWVMSWLGRS